MIEKKELNKKAVKAGIWYTIGNILLKGCIFLTLPIFTRILSTKDFGVYNTYMAYEGLLTAIIGLGLYGTVKNAKLDFEEKFNDYLSSMITLSLIFFITIIIISNFLYVFYEKAFGFSRLITNCLILQSYGSFLIYFYGAKLNIEFKYKSYIIISFLNTFLNIIISIILILFVFPNQRYIGRILGSAIPLIILAIVLTLVILFKGKTYIKKEYWKYGLSIGIPLVPHVISQSLLSQFDRIMINNMTSPSYAGIYSYIYTICTITFVICQSLDNSWTPWVYMKIKNNQEEDIKKAGTKYVLLFSLLTIGFICIMPEITGIIADKTYMDGINLIVPLTLANYYVFMYMLPVGIEYYNKKTNFISAGTVGAAIINLILNIITIKLFGYKAAAYTTLISYIILYYFHRIISSRYNINKCYDFKKITKLNLLTLLVGLLVLFTLKYNMISFVIRYIIILIVLIILSINGKIFFGIFRRKGNEQ